MWGKPTDWNLFTEVQVSMFYLSFGKAEHVPEDRHPHSGHSDFACSDRQSPGGVCFWGAIASVL